MGATDVGILAAALRERYTVDRELGRGGMATVYLARDLKHDRLVALKVLHPELAHALGAERFLREIRLTARLDHPHILPVFDSGDADGLLWYTMPYVEGESLRDRLRREGQLPLEEALRLAQEVADALECAHRQGIIHRDIKPENILLARGHARVADFGLARAVEAGGARRLTETGLAVGTPAYMSPEQASAGQVDARSDIYALGCVVFEMLAGEPPYTGPTAQAVIAKRFSEPIPRLSTVRAVPPGIEAAVARALAKAPADRFVTASEFSWALQVPPPATEAPGGRRVRGARAWLLLAGALALLAMAATYRLWRRPPAAGAAETPNGPPVAAGARPLAGPSIAVLPFTNLSPNRENEYFSDGMTEELITALGRVEGLQVAARTSAFALKGSNLDARAVGETLHVATVLEGSVRRAGDRLRVAAQLVDSRSGYHLWSDEYDRQLKDVFAVQEELARAIVGALRVRLEPAGRPRAGLVEPATADLEAHDLYLQGRSVWNQRTAESFRRAVDFFDRAIARDSGFAQAYAGLADTYVLLPFYGHTRPSDAFPQAKAAALRALALDSTLAEAHASLGYVLAVADFDWHGAETEFRRAIALNPSYATAHHWYADYLDMVGRPDEAVAEIERARRLDPLSRIIAGEVGYTYMMARRYDDALRQLRATLELDPGFPQTWSYLCGVYVLERMPREATAACERATALSGRIKGMGRLAVAYALAGERPKAAAVLRELKARSRREYVPPHFIAQAELAVGDTARAFEWLERAYAARDPTLTQNLFDPLWDPLRADPRFVRLRQRMGLPP